RPSGPRSPCAPDGRCRRPPPSAPGRRRGTRRLRRIPVPARSSLKLPFRKNLSADSVSEDLLQRELLTAEYLDGIRGSDVLARVRCRMQRRAVPAEQGVRRDTGRADEVVFSLV